MNFQILDTESSYRRLLSADDEATRTQIFDDELIAPFAGLVQTMGFGNDGRAAFKMWGMSPEQFAEPGQAAMTARLDALKAANAWNRAIQALERGYAAFAAYHDRVPTESITFGLMLCDMSGLPIQRGYSGFGAIPGWIMTVYDTPDAYNLERLEAATVHELHHNILASVKPDYGPSEFMNVSLADYMIMEGLAESFAAELYGPDRIGFWVTDFDASRMDETRRMFRDKLELRGFQEVQKYIFGDGMMPPGQGVGVPAFAGYALGYHTVQAYLQRTGAKVADTSFVPARQIIAESRFFEV